MFFLQVSYVMNFNCMVNVMYRYNSCYGFTIRIPDIFNLHLVMVDENVSSTLKY